MLPRKADFAQDMVMNMKRRFLAAVMALCIVFGFASCSDNNADSTPLYASMDSLDNCNHVDGYHTIPGGLIRFVGGNEAVEQRFTSIYQNTEAYNVINFIKVFDISKESFTTMVSNYSMQLNETTQYDIDIMFSDDDKVIDEYFTKK